MGVSVYVELSDGREGYILTEMRPDGSIVVVPDKTRTHMDADEVGHDPSPPPTDQAR